MGKTKTAFVSDITEKPEKTSEGKYREKKEKQAREKAEKPQKVHIAGLKGGQRIKIVEAEMPKVTEILSDKVTEKKDKKTQKAPRARGKKYQESKSKTDRSKLYSQKEAVKLVKETSYSKFDGSIELHMIVKKVGVSTSVTLPNSTGRTKKIEIAIDETIKKIQSGKIDFDVLLATAEMMPKLVPFAKVLGPRGLMPNPKNGTLIKSEKEANKFSVNSLNLRTEKEAPLIHTVIGKVSQKDEEVIENLEAVLNALGKSKQIVKAYLKATMGPSVKLTIS